MTPFRLFLGLILPVAGFLIQCTSDERNNILDPNAPNFLGREDPEKYQLVIDYLRNNPDETCTPDECLVKAEQANSLVTLTIDNRFEDGNTLGSSVFTLRGKIETINELQFISVTVNDSDPLGPTIAGQNWQIEIHLKEGSNLIEIAAGDRKGNTVLKTLTLYYDADQGKDLQAPVLKVFLKDSDTSVVITNNSFTETSQNPVEIFGTIKDQSGTNLKVISPANFTGLQFTDDTSWTITTPLTGDTNVFVLEASDNAEPPNNTTFVFNLLAKGAIPLSIDITAPANNTQVSRADSLRVEVAAFGTELPSAVTVNGVSASADDNGLWVAYISIAPDTLTGVVARAVNESGEEAADAITVTHVSNPNDNEGPVITLISPENGASINDTTTLVRVKVTDASGVSKVELKVGSEITPMTDKGNGDYEATLSLDPDAVTTFTILAEDNSANKNTSNQTYNVSANPDLDPPEIVFVSHHDSQAVTNKKPTVRFSVDDPSGLDESDPVRINSEEAAYNEGQGVYEKEVVLNDTGFTTIEVTASDTWGNKDTLEFHLRYDGSGPQITVNSPENNATVNESQINVSVSASDPSTVEGVQIDGEMASLSEGFYSRTVTLTEGENTIPIIARDSLENVTPMDLVVNYVDNSGPDFHQPSIQNGATLYDLNVTFSVTVQDASGVAEVLINDQQASVDDDDVYSVTLQLVEGENTITVDATDSAATPNNSQLQISVTAVDTTGPDLEIVSPTADTIYDEAFATVVVSAGDPSGLEGVWINNVEANPGQEVGTYQSTVSLSAGRNSIEIRATDESEAGNTTLDTLDIFRYISVRGIEVENMTMLVGDTAEPVITWTPVNATNKAFYLTVFDDEDPPKIRIVDSTRVEGLALTEASFVLLHSLAPETGNLDQVAFSVRVIGVGSADTTRVEP